MTHATQLAAYVKPYRDERFNTPEKRINEHLDRLLEWWQHAKACEAAQVHYAEHRSVQRAIDAGIAAVTGETE